jgi:Glycosyl transferase family 11
MSFAALEAYGDDWDAVMLGGHGEEPVRLTVDLGRVRESMSCTALIVKRSYLRTLLACFEQSYAGLTRAPVTPELYHAWALDRVWNPLQERDRWLAFYPYLVGQRVGYSSIEVEVKDYRALLRGRVRFRQSGSGRRRLVACLQGGMGNQMFIWACGAALAAEMGMELCVVMRVGPRAHEVFSLGHYGIQLSENAPAAEECERLGDHESYRVGWESALWEQVARSEADDFWLDGYMQHEAFFRGHAAMVREQFALPVRRLPEVGERTPVAVQVRRADFTEVTNHLVCTARYFRQAMALVRALVARPHFIVISDGIDWCREVFEGEEDVTFYGTVDIQADYEVMYGCEAFIISNSTYGWWPAWWTGARLVIHPTRWLRVGEWVVGPDRWLALPGDGVGEAGA